MPLLVNIDEVRKFLPVAVATNVESIQGFIPQAEERFLIPEIGQELYDDLLEKYDANDLDPDHLLLLEKVQRVLTYYSYYLAIPSMQLLFDDSGIHIAVTEHFKSAFDHQIDRLEDSFSDAGDYSMDQLIAFLDKNKDTFTVWRDSDAFTQFKECFVSTTSILNSSLSIHLTHRKFKRLKSELLKAEEDYIYPVTGAGLFEELQGENADNDYSASNRKLLKYIYAACSAHAVAESASALMLDINDLGITVSTNSIMKQRIKQKAPDNVVDSLVRKLLADRDRAVKKLQEFLYNNADDYPLFKESSAYDTGRTTSFDNNEFKGLYTP